MLRGVLQTLIVYAVLAAVVYVYANYTRWSTNVDLYKKKYKQLFGYASGANLTDATQKPAAKALKGTALHELTREEMEGPSVDIRLNKSRHTENYGDSKLTVRQIDYKLFRKLLDDQDFIYEAADAIYQNRRMRYTIYIKKLEEAKRTAYGSQNNGDVSHKVQEAKEAHIINLVGILDAIEASLANIDVDDVRNDFLSIYTDPSVGLDSIVGREEVKNAVMQRIYLFIKNPRSITKRYLNMAFLGGSGLGKSRLARFVAHAYNKAGIFTKKNIVKADSRDFMSSYVASGSHMTHALLESGLETVVYYDEAYGLGGNLHDSSQVQNGAFAAMVAHTEENKGLSAVIVCGYHDRMAKDFFGMNDGLERRFPARFHIRNYTSEELTLIFIGFLEEQDIHISEKSANIAFTLIKRLYYAQPWLFKLQAGAMETLASTFIEVNETIIETVDDGDALFKGIMKKAMTQAIEDGSLYGV